MQAAKLLAVIIAAILPIHACAQSTELLQRLPGSSNAIILWNVEKVLSSKMSQDAGWAEKYASSYSTGLASVPPNAKFAVIASEIDLQKWDCMWTLAAFDLNNNVNLSGIAKHYEGVLDEIAGVKCVALSKDAYVMQFGKQQVTAYAPGNRQAIARWVRETQTKRTLSPYLEHALARSKVLDLVQAFDLADAIPAKVVEAKVKSSTSFVGKSDAVIASAVDVVKTLQGLTLEVMIKSEADARLVVDFGADAAPLNEAGKNLLIEVLGDAGLAMDDMDNWKGRVEGKKFILQGKLSAGGLQRVFQLIDQPIASFVAESGANAEGSSGDAATAYASQRYFQDINHVLADIKTTANKSDNSLKRYARWFDKWSDDIEAQSILNVDPELLNYGRAVSKTLRECSDSIRGIGLAASSRSSGQGYGYYSTWNNYTASTGAVHIQAAAVGATNARELFRSIEDASSKMRATLTERYKRPF